MKITKEQYEMLVSGRTPERASEIAEFVSPDAMTLGRLGTLAVLAERIAGVPRFDDGGVDLAPFVKTIAPAEAMAKLNQILAARD